MAPCVRFGTREEGLQDICEPEIFVDTFRGKFNPPRNDKYLLSDLGGELIFSQGFGRAGTPFLLRLFFLISWSLFSVLSML